MVNTVCQILANKAAYVLICYINKESSDFIVYYTS